LEGKNTHWLLAQPHLITDYKLQKQYFKITIKGTDNQQKETDTPKEAKSASTTIRIVHLQCRNHDSHVA
jgi:hypothetical protein